MAFVTADDVHADSIGTEPLPAADRSCGVGMLGPAVGVGDHPYILPW